MSAAETPRLAVGSARNAALAALWGALCIIGAFPTVDLVVPVLLAWPPLLFLAPRMRWKRRLWAGLLMGFVYNLVIFRWVAFTMQVMTNMPPVAAYATWVAFALWHGLMCGVFLALAEPARRAALDVVERSGRSARWVGPVAVATVWAAVEWAWPAIFPWTFGHAFWQVGPIATTMALTGPLGLSFLVVLLGAGAAAAWRTRAWRPLVAPGVISLVLLGFGVAWYAHISSAEPRRVLKVAIIQPNYTLEEKRKGTFPVRQDHLRRITERIRRIPEGRVDLIVGPEGGFPFKWRVDADQVKGETKLPFDLIATRRVQAAVREGPKADLVMGGLRRPDGEQMRNAAVHIAPDGKIAGYYDKQHLVPFGEYMPGRDLFPSLRKAIKGISDFAEGEGPCQFRAAGEPMSCGICYETMFSDLVRDDLGDAKLLLNLTIDVWFGDSTAPWFHLMVHASRAAEHSVPLIRAALNGISAVIGPDGTLTATVGLHADEILYADVPLLDTTTPYRAAGPFLRWLALVLAVALLIQARRRRRELFAEEGVSEIRAASAREPGV